VIATLQQSLSPRLGSERLLQEIVVASIISRMGCIHVGIIGDVKQTTQHCNRDQELERPKSRLHDRLQATM
jgi:hypothetical protein